MVANACTILVWSLVIMVNRAATRALKIAMASHYEARVWAPTIPTLSSYN